MVPYTGTLAGYWGGYRTLGLGKNRKLRSSGAAGAGARGPGVHEIETLPPPHWETVSREVSEYRGDTGCYDDHVCTFFSLGISLWVERRKHLNTRGDRAWMDGPSRMEPLV